MATGHKHGFVEFNVGRIMGNHVHQHKLGRVMGGEVGIYTARQPDSVRAADVAFVSHERLAKVQSHSYLDVAPELVVEVLSPDDRWSEVKTKLAEYFAIGVQLIWVIDPQREAVFVYRALHEVEILGLDDEITGDSLLPEFKVAVAEFFAD
jgi:Uma2 family endonuclease